MIEKERLRGIEQTGNTYKFNAEIFNVIVLIKHSLAMDSSGSEQQNQMDKNTGLACNTNRTSFKSTAKILNHYNTNALSVPQQIY